VPMLAHPLADGLELVLLEPRHAEPLYVATEENRDHLREWLPWVDATRSPRDTLDFIERSRRQLAANEGVTTALRFQGEICGVVGHVRIDWRSRAAALGYWLAEPFQGRGYMTLACRAYLEYSFNELELNRIEIRAATANRRSRAIPERLGFQLEGVVRESEWLYDHFVDHAVYGLLRSEWLAGKPPPVG
jgi:ribosomal-protein-serine acetyltransferase